MTVFKWRSFIFFLLTSCSTVYTKDLDFEGSVCVELKILRATDDKDGKLIWMAPPDLYLESGRESLVWDVEVVRVRGSDKKSKMVLKTVFFEVKKSEIKNNSFFGILERRNTKDTDSSYYVFTSKDCFNE